LAKCENDSLLGAQTLYVVGEQIGGGELLLRFYPETPPDDSTKCQAKIPFAGGGKYRRPAGNYLALNDKRWSTPDTGYRIEIPDDGVFTTIHYQDQTANVPELNVCSIFFVQVTRPDPNAAPTMTPFPNPGAPCAGGAAPP
jgi:hypothetical protein